MFEEISYSARKVCSNVIYKLVLRRRN